MNVKMFVLRPEGGENARVANGSSDGKRGEKDGKNAKKTARKRPEAASARGMVSHQEFSAVIFPGA